MLVHHADQDYNVSASEAAKAARAKFEASIENGKAKALKVFDQIQTQIPEDKIVVGQKLSFSADTRGLRVQFPNSDHTEGFHKNAINQAASRADIPVAYVESLQARGEWGRELLAENFNEIFHNDDKKRRYLTRSVNGDVRGFLSDSYRRMDSRPIVEQFVGAMQKYNAVPVEGYALETKIAIKAVLPFIFEPVDHEVMIFGVALETSDFGNGALSLRSFVERLWCTNRAIANEDIRKIHLGARLGEDLQLSQRTYDLDTQTMASAVQDVVTKSLSADNVNTFMALIKTANEQKIEPSKVMAFLKKNLNKSEADAVIDAFNSPDVEMLPAGNSVWRMSNAISWIANTVVTDEERRLDVMKTAGAILDHKFSVVA